MTLTNRYRGPRAGTTRRPTTIHNVAAAYLLALCLCGTSWADEPGSNPNPVRSSTAWGLDIIAEGCARSPSFRSIVDRLRQTNLVVYVEPARHLPGFMIGATEFVGVNGDFRYVRVSIRLGSSKKNVIALLGHELQHALEIGLAPEVVDQATLEALYRRIGDRSVDGVDSAAARATGDRVYEELWKSRRINPELTTR